MRLVFLHGAALLQMFTVGFFVVVVVESVKTRDWRGGLGFRRWALDPLLRSKTANTKLAVLLG